MDLIDDLEERQIHREQQIIHELLRDHSNPFHCPDVVFRNLFRLPKEAVKYLIENLELVESRLPKHLKVFAALHFFALGKCQRSVGSSYLSSQATVSRCITRVSNAIAAKLLPLWVKFPRFNTEQPGSFEKLGFRSVLGAIGGTHIAIVKPRQNKQPNIYKNNHGYYSVNTQIVCDQDKKILNITECPGSTLSAVVWQCSRIGKVMKDNYSKGNKNTWLLGDSCYPAYPWLLTPFASPSTPEEDKYNLMHTQARSYVLSTIGLLKGRFRCLTKDRVLHYKPKVALKIVRACVTLHNLCLHYGAEDVEGEWDESDLVRQPPMCFSLEEDSLTVTANQVRAQYAHENFGD
ncbi:putative nuclease HARBI1 [Halyomorpha halys]|uniref:putative nuclease HARBI1 n=1 Tax=Halyomorpha halys TaxID=286706 RepID=UPI0006D511B1|nr:putative nuclease HARBI1 [Halyomorpha halys]XP_014292440.1 putative nuclease HARBI1 [Halyomorpha halys]